MDDQELRKLLDQLHNEIEQTESIDEKGRELLRDLATDISELLVRSNDGQAKAQPSLLGRLEDSISYLGVTHPTLTQALARMLETLSNAGI
jgi:hypothetical protein